MTIGGFREQLTIDISQEQLDALVTFWYEMWPEAKKMTHNVKQIQHGVDGYALVGYDYHDQTDVAVFTYMKDGKEVKVKRPRDRRHWNREEYMQRLRCDLRNPGLR